MGKNIVRMIIQTREVTIVRLWRSSSTITDEETSAITANEVKGAESDGKRRRSLERSVRLLHLSSKVVKAILRLAMRTM
jgi:hypothetical protein